MSATLWVAVVLLGASHPSRPVAAAPRPFEVRAAEARRLTVPQLLGRVRALDADLEFDQVVPFAQELATRSDAGPAIAREAQLTLARVLVILGDPMAAEAPFAQVLRADPDFELPANVEPKVALVFRKVQADELARATAQHAAQRDATVRSVVVAGGASTSPSPTGGKPIPFSFTVADPTGAVRTARLAYRREGEQAFSSLALGTDGEQAWSVTLPAELTQSEEGFTLEYYLETADEEGPLTLEGSPAAPRRLSVAPGKVPASWHAPLPRALFFVSSALTLLAAGASTALYVNYRAQQSAFERYTSDLGPVSYAVSEDLRLGGTAAAQRATLALAGAASMLVITVVIGLLTDWSS